MFPLGSDSPRGQRRARRGRLQGPVEGVSLAGRPDLTQATDIMGTGSTMSTGVGTTA